VTAAKKQQQQQHQADEQALQCVAANTAVQAYARQRLVGAKHLLHPCTVQQA
jgi:hypothetical protein